MRNITVRKKTRQCKPHCKLQRILLLIVCWVVIGFSSALFADDNHSSKPEVHGEFKGAKDATHPSWFKQSFLDLEEDIADAAEDNKRLVIYFWQPGCPYCDQLWSDNFADKQVEDEFRNSFDLVAMNMWGDREIVNVGGNTYSEKTFAAALGIKYTPTLLFFDENNKVVHRLNGYVPVENFKNSMQYVASKAEKTSSFAAFSKNNSNKSAATNARLHTQEFFAQPVFNLNRQQNSAIKSDYIAVFFEAPQCKNCDLLHNKTLKDPETLSLVKRFHAVQLNRYSNVPVITPSGVQTTAQQWATDLDIEYLPAMLFFDSQGKQVMRVDSQLRTFHVQSVFDYVLSGAYEKEKSFQRYISNRADKIIESGRDVDIFAY